jgi:hypothetical protein
MPHPISLAKGMLVHSQGHEWMLGVMLGKRDSTTASCSHHGHRVHDFPSKYPPTAFILCVNRMQ